MKKLLLFLLSVTLSFATPLQNLAHTLSPVEKAALLKEFSNSSKLHTTSFYELKKGWNSLTAPADGINVVETFHDASKIKYVLTYYKLGKLWAIYAPRESFNDMLFLKYLEKGVKFFVLAKEDIKVTIKSNSISQSCKKYADDTANYTTLTDSGIKESYTESRDNTISLQSRYYSHHTRGIYNDTRITLIYPKQKRTTKRTLKYAPAIPKMAILFAKEYEGKIFYAYDFKEKKCFKGVFPSKRIPPFPLLKEQKN